MCGTLYVIATPIGNLNDISSRALDILSKVDILACEDTRHSSSLLQHFGLKTKLTSLHAHNEQTASLILFNKLQAGENVGLVSDAGTPLISDPGFYLVQLALQAGIKVSPIAGPCAAIAALSVSAIPSSSFVFEGFLPSKSSARRQKIGELQHEKRTIILYEAPHRLLDCVQDLADIFGGERMATLAREISKTFETILHGSLAELTIKIKQDSNQQRGECVLVIAGNFEITNNKQQLNEQHITTLKLLLSELPLAKAVQLTAKITGLRKNLIYEYALNLT